MNKIIEHDAAIVGDSERGYIAVCGAHAYTTADRYFDTEKLQDLFTCGEDAPHRRYLTEVREPGGHSGPPLLFDPTGLAFDVHAFAEHITYGGGHAESELLVWLWAGEGVLRPLAVQREQRVDPDRKGQVIETWSVVNEESGDVHVQVEVDIQLRNIRVRA